MSDRYTVEPGRIIHFGGVEVFRITRKSEDAVLSPAAVDSATRYIARLLNELNVRIFPDGTIYDDRHVPEHTPEPEPGSLSAMAKKFAHDLQLVRENPEAATKAIVRALYFIERAILIRNAPVRMNDAISHIDQQLDMAKFELEKLFNGVAPSDDRICEREGCGKKLDPRWPAVYCSNDCAFKDA